MVKDFVVGMGWMCVLILACAALVIVVAITTWVLIQLGLPMPLPMVAGIVVALLLMGGCLQVMERRHNSR